MIWSVIFFIVGWGYVFVSAAIAVLFLFRCCRTYGGLIVVLVMMRRFARRRVQNKAALLQEYDESPGNAAAHGFRVTVSGDDSSRVAPDRPSISDAYSPSTCAALSCSLHSNRCMLLRGFSRSCPSSDGLDAPRSYEEAVLSASPMERPFPIDADDGPAY